MLVCVQNDIPYTWAGCFVVSPQWLWRLCCAGVAMIITSLLDTDLYKFTMMQVVLHQFPGAQVEYRFRCRQPGVRLAPLADEIREHIRALCGLRFSRQELDYLRSLRFIKSDFVDFLGLFRLNEKYVTVTPLDSDSGAGDLDITVRGPWLHVVLFEIPVLAIVHELYYRSLYPVPDLDEGRSRLRSKIAQLRTPDLRDLRIADYGTRRRFSRAWHEEVLHTLCEGLGTQAGPGGGQFAGTSNVLHAMQLGLTPLGAMSHEFVQACQALGPRLRDSQVFGLDAWAREYRGDLGIAVSDIYGMRAFLRDFDLYFCKLFDGVRHDSDDPFVWGEHMLAHYHAHRVDPLDKTLIFSNGLTMDSTIALFRHFRGRCQLAFGIGAHLTNDLGLAAPLPIALKMTRCNGQPIASQPGIAELAMCDDPKYLAYLRQVFEIPRPGTAP